MIDFSKFNSLIDIALYFDTEEKCKETIAQARWSDGDVICPYCGAHNCHKRKDGRYVCRNCNHNFSVTVGTIFENTKISLVKWFMAMYLISSHKKGVSSHQIARDVHITQKSAWYILHKIRSLYQQDDSIALEGEVECEILTIFEANHRDYIALLPLNPDGSENEEGTVYLYRYAEDEEGMPQIDMIADEGEYSLAAKRFDELLDEEGYFETEEE